jgi:hypothetical protein
MTRRLPALLAAAAVLLAGCGASVVLQPAPHAADPGCAEVMVAVRKIDQVGDLPRRTTTAQSTAAWGDPPVVLHCGVEPPGPTTDACVDVDGVDWVARPELNGSTSYTTYGRVPAVQLTVPAGEESVSDVLVQLGPPAALIPQQRHCL